MDDRQGGLLRGLLDKYRTIHGMRMAAAQHSREHARTLMADLAKRFPGALRELDELPLDLIRQRMAALEGTLARGVAPERWMLLQASYHGHMRAVLRLRGVLRGPLAKTDLARVGEAYVPAADEPSLAWLDARVLAQIARPAGGRLNPWVFEEVAKLHAATAEDVRRALFMR